MDDDSMMMNDEYFIIVLNYMENQMWMMDDVGDA